MRHEVRVTRREYVNTEKVRIEAATGFTENVFRVVRVADEQLLLRVDLEITAREIRASVVLGREIPFERRIEPRLSGLDRRGSLLC
jgi:hypothetical protein